MSLVLPTQPVPATSVNPQYLILYGLPKVFGPIKSDFYSKNV